MEKIKSLQELHYASHRHALLLIFQGMDGAGKDGAILYRLRVRGVNPEGCEAYSSPSSRVPKSLNTTLRRTTCRLPERGRIGIFNRSYYEDAGRSSPSELLRSQGLSQELHDSKTSGPRGMTPYVIG